jgi:hypothetical protein
MISYEWSNQLMVWYTERKLVKAIDNTTIT